MLRIIGGIHRSRKIEQPSREITRPTTDRVKEAIFSSIQFKIKNAIILDLFSGSGSLALEAVSRGAMKAYCVDNSSDAIDVIKHNKELLNMNNVEVIKQDAISFVRNKKGTNFDFIFIDPPFQETNLYTKTLAEIEKCNLLSPTGLIILETDNPKEIIIPKNLMIQKTKEYGKITILLISKM